MECTEPGGDGVGPIHLEEDGGTSIGGRQGTTASSAMVVGGGRGWGCSGLCTGRWFITVAVPEDSRILVTRGRWLG